MEFRFAVVVYLLLFVRGWLVRLLLLFLNVLCLVFVCLGWWIAHLCLLYVCGLLPFAFCVGWVCMNDDLAC